MFAAVADPETPYSEKEIASAPRCWLIVSWEHNAFWRPAELGYTQLVEEAGRYSFSQASFICRRANIARPKDGPNEVMVIAPEFIK
jgi:hypothetical protein